MTLRSSIASLLGSLRSKGLHDLRGASLAVVGGAAALGLIAIAGAGSTGCGSGDSVICDSAGRCQICDSLGCRLAQGSGGASSSSASGAGGHQGTGGHAATGGQGSGGQVGAGGHAGSGGHPGAGGAHATGGSGGAGGYGPCNPSDELCGCTNGTCPTGESCIGGLCITGCNFTYECGSGKVCDNGACVPGCSAGQPCTAGSMCMDGACVPNPASPACSATVPCPTGQVCNAGICQPPCGSNGDCPAGDACDGVTHTCIPDPSPKPLCGPTMPCPTSEICGTDGFCHYPCSTLSDCQKIDNRFVACSNFVCKTQEEVNPQCTLSMPCPAGKSCISNTCY